ncbi:hypothetical protein D3C75_1161970 [compost metagenome]
MILSLKLPMDQGPSIFIASLPSANSWVLISKVRSATLGGRMLLRDCMKVRPFTAPLLFRPISEESVPLLPKT